jgi:hypothetical protein
MIKIRLVYILCFSFSLHSLLNAQTTKLITRDTKEYLEEFDVLESDRKVKHGSYVKIYKGAFGISFRLIGNYKGGLKHGYWEKYYLTDNNIASSGFFKNGIQDSIWTYFYEQEQERELKQIQTPEGIKFEIVGAIPVPILTGMYRDGQPVGIWKFFDKNGQVMHVFDYDSRTLLGDKRDDVKICNPMMGSVDFFYQQLSERINYVDEFASRVTPKTGQEERIIEVEFKVDQLGQLYDFNLAKDEINLNKLNERIKEAIASLRWLFHSNCGDRAIGFRFTVFSKPYSKLLRSEKGQFSYETTLANLYIKYLN